MPAAAVSVDPPRRPLAAVALLLALLAAVTGSPQRGSLNAVTLATEIEHESDHVTALELAQWIRDRKAGLRIIDIRPDSEFRDFHIPTAERVPLTSLATLQPAGNETLVLYSEGGAHAAQGWVLLRSLGFTRVYFLRGGLLDWMDDVMNPALPALTGNAATDSVRTHAADLSRYFGGAPRMGVAQTLPAATGSAATGATAPTAVARAKRRGC